MYTFRLGINVLKYSTSKSDQVKETMTISNPHHCFLKIMVTAIYRMIPLEVIKELLPKI
jgi:hypothetical protein